MFQKLVLAAICFLMVSCSKTTIQHSELKMNWSTPEIPSLDVLSIENLRERPYQSSFELLEKVDNNSTGYSTYMASYLSDGLRVYARVDVPNVTSSNSKFPVLIYSHGWVGIDEAPTFNFFIDQKGSQAQYIDSFAKHGYVVVTPGWRGHGTVNNIPADGIEFMRSWDNATYLSPIFYSMDLLNALEGLSSINNWSLEIQIDANNVFMASHSQGGDSALLTLAVAGESSSVKQGVKASSFFAGCFLPRLEQGKLYGSMASTPQAFMSGDGNWTASKFGKTGAFNPDFQFPYPPDWIGQTNIAEWTWQKDVWHISTVYEAYKNKYDEMYSYLKNQYLITNEMYNLDKNSDGKTQISHPSKILNAYAKTSAINYPEWLTEPIVLHHSDQDYYSPPKWNKRLEKLLIAQGSQVWRKEYRANTHSLTVSKNTWFSPPGTIAGIDEMIKTDLELFSKLMQE